jgi:Leucine-rich repeat (LRR) protein
MNESFESESSSFLDWTPECTITTEKDTLELCHYNISKFPDLNTICKSLQRLVILAQDITDINGIQTCINLEQLWVCETKISRVDQLSSCTRLKRLHLCVLFNCIPLVGVRCR